MKIPQSIANLNLWMEVQKEINSHRIVKSDFSKTLEEKVLLANVKKRHREQMKNHPVEYKQHLAALLDCVSHMSTPHWGSLTFNGVNVTQ